MEHRPRKKKAHAVVASFVDKLAKMLDTPQYNDIISWTDDGQAFTIKSVTKLTQTVLPIFFKHRNFSSFIRQLNMYNFNKVRRQAEDNVYMNEHFHKNSRNQYKYIKRRAVEDKDDLLLCQYNSNTQLVKDISQMTKKQKQLESVIRHLVSENQSLRAQNGKLWKKIEKNMERSDKKIEKLLLFMLFGGQNQQQNESSNMIGSDGQDKKYVEAQAGRYHMNGDLNPRQALAKNLLSMLETRKGSMDLRNLLSDCTKETKKRIKSKKAPEYIKEEQRMPSVEKQLNLQIKEHGEELSGQLKIKSEPELDDVNLYLNIEIPPSDNQFPLI